MNFKRTLVPLLGLLTAFILSGCELSLAQDITPPPNYQRVSIEGSSTEAIFVLPDDAPDLSAGAALFAESCAPCHGESGLGDGSRAANLPSEPPKIGSADLAEQSSPADWFEMITSGNIENLMPPFENSLSVQDRWDVLAYVYSLSSSQAMLAEVLPEGMQIAELPQPISSETPVPAVTEGPTVGTDATDVAVTEEQNGEEAADASPTETEENPAQNLGTITGLVTHGGGEDLPTDLEITLLGFDGLELAFNDSISISSDGSFVFEGIDLIPDRIFLVNLNYQDTSYGSRFEVMPDDENTLDMPVTIYETTKDSSNLVIVTLVVRFEFPTAEVVRLNYIYQVSNPTMKTVIPPSSGEPVLQYTLPQNALNFTFDQQTNTDSFVITSDGFGDTRALLANTEDYTLSFSYELPYASTFTIDLHPGWEVDRLIVLLPPGGPQIKNDFMNELEETQIGSIVYQVYSGGPFQRGELQLEIAGRNPSAPPGFLGLDLDIDFVVSLSLFLVILVFAVMRIKAVRAGGRRNKIETPEDIMDAIITLDDNFEAGNIQAEIYHRRRQTLKARLVKLLQGTKE